MFTFDVLDSKVILWEPSFEIEELLVKKQLVLEIKDSGKRRIVHVDKELVADEVEFKLFDPVFYHQNFFVDHMAVLFRVFELSTCMSTEVVHAIYPFKENGTPIVVTGICLQNALASCWNFEWRRWLGYHF